jgi:hypothetical protein
MVPVSTEQGSGRQNLDPETGKTMNLRWADQQNRPAVIHYQRNSYHF